MRSWLAGVCSATPNGRSVLDEVEAYCLYVLLHRLTNEEFIAITDEWIQRIIDGLLEPATPEFVFMISVSCFTEEWVMGNLGSVLWSSGFAGENAMVSFYDYLVSRYQKITEDNRQVQGLSDIIGNFQLN